VAFPANQVIISIPTKKLIGRQPGVEASRRPVFPIAAAREDEVVARTAVKALHDLRLLFSPLPSYPSDYTVVSGTAEHGVVPAAALDDVVSGAAGDRVVTMAGADVFD
jgi:hypothetical protein